MDHSFDVIVIGTGTAAATVAAPCRKAGKSVAIIDELPYGGTCALRGCDPKKMLIAPTEGINWIHAMKGKGLEGEISARWPDMVAFKRTFTDNMPPRIEKGLEKAGVTVLHGSARFTGPDSAEIDGKPYRAKHFHIATGARPMTLDIPGEEHLLTSTDFLEMPELPARLAFVGGGFIAMEFAHISKRAGAAEVTVLEMADRPLGNFDPDMVEMLVAATADLGVEVKTGAKVLEIRKTGAGFEVDYQLASGTRTMACDAVVHATGRVPNIDELNLDAAGVEHSRKGIKVSAYMRTTNRAIFAAGDCAESGPNLTPVSANEGRIAGKNLLAGKDERAVDYPPIPSVVFTLPQAAMVGLSEAGARDKGLDFETHFEKTDGWYSSMRVGARCSGFKVLVENGSGKILGAHLLGPGAEEQINLFAMAMKAGLTANQIKGLIFAYPSYASDIGSMV
jgi:glutathione reductase (NADPH)